jgi:hypothetical protein
MPDNRKGGGKSGGDDAPEKKLTPKQRRRRRNRREDRQDRREERRENQLEKLSPMERRRRIERLEDNDDLSKKQRKTRIRNTRQSGPVWSEERFEEYRRRQRRKHRDKGGAEHPGLPPRDMNALAILEQKFKDYGLSVLVPKISSMLEQGWSAPEIELELQETTEWKLRFAGNERLRANGLPVLSVAEYLSVEQSYAQIMKNYGVPQGFYDDPSDFADWIGKSVSPGELEQRVSSYADVANREDPAVKQQLRSMGMTDGDLLAFMMDPGRAAPLIQRRFQTVLLGGAARRASVEANNEYLGKLAGMGVTEQQAQEGYGLISENLGAIRNLGQIYGDEYNRSDFEQEVFENSGDSMRKRKRLASQERGAFSGGSGVGQGSLNRSSAGSY